MSGGATGAQARASTPPWRSAAPCRRRHCPRGRARRTATGPLTSRGAACRLEALSLPRMSEPSGAFAHGRHADPAARSRSSPPATSGGPARRARPVPPRLLSRRFRSARAARARSRRLAHFLVGYAGDVLAVAVRVDDLAGQRLAGAVGPVRHEPARRGPGLAQGSDVDPESLLLALVGSQLPADDLSSRAVRVEAQPVPLSTVLVGNHLGVLSRFARGRATSVTRATEPRGS